MLLGLDEGGVSTPLVDMDRDSGNPGFDFRVEIACLYTSHKEHADIELKNEL